MGQLIDAILTIQRIDAVYCHIRLGYFIIIECVQWRTDEIIILAMVTKKNGICLFELHYNAAAKIPIRDFHN